jgi:hypothetical protein
MLIMMVFVINVFQIVITVKIPILALIMVVVRDI